MLMMILNTHKISLFSVTRLLARREVSFNTNQLKSKIRFKKFIRNITSKTMNEKIRTFVFMDLETTGLPQYEHNRTKIIEICMIAVEADHLELGVFPRAHNKLSLCFNPYKMISPEAANITGLNNELLEHKSRFSANSVQMIKHFLDSNPKPICLVAHNGNRFDFPILRAEIFNTDSNLDDDILCLDSIIAFRDLEKQKRLEEMEQKQQEEERIPIELTDNFDEILCQVAEDLENSNSDKLTPEQIQKMNETTPKKNIIVTSSSGRINRNLFKVKSSLSYKLNEVYRRLTCKEPVMEHQAEGDVVMMLTCCAVFAEKFVDYACKQSRKFNDIPRMQPGRSLGL